MNNRVRLRLKPPEFVRQCPVCNLGHEKHNQVCCSESCDERLEDARVSIGWLRIVNTNLWSELHELQERLGRVQVKLEKAEAASARLALSWQVSVYEGFFERANKLGDRGSKANRQVFALLCKFKPLEKRWKKLVKNCRESSLEVRELEAIIDKAL